MQITMSFFDQCTNICLSLQGIIHYVLRQHTETVIIVNLPDVALHYPCPTQNPSVRWFSAQYPPQVASRYFPSIALYMYGTKEHKPSSLAAQIIQNPLLGHFTFSLFSNKDGNTTSMLKVLFKAAERRGAL